MKHLLIFFFLAACSKQQIEEKHYQFTKYELVVDRYSLDTTFRGSRWIEVFDSIWKPETKLAFDTLREMWYVDCSMLDSLQHLYYRRNGNPYGVRGYPKDNPK